MQRRYSTYLVILLSFIGTLTATAQKFEIGALIGGSYYYGDIVNELQLKTIRGAGGLFIRYHLNERVVIKAFGGYARVMGADSTSTSSFQRNRNLSFWSDIYEGSAQIEYNLIEDRYRGRRLLNKFIPYVFVGVGGFYFNSKSNYPVSNVAVGLAPLHTEGKAYNQYAVCVPFGAGVRYYVTRKIQVGLELGIRYTSTTYIDDVGGKKAFYPDPKTLPSAASIAMSYRGPGYNYAENPAGFPTGKQRGKISVNDLYVIGGLTISYRFGSAGGGGYRGRAVRCPRFY